MRKFLGSFRHGFISYCVMRYAYCARVKNVKLKVQSHSVKFKSDLAVAVARLASYCVYHMAPKKF
jgi:hypothetical protein